MLVRDTKDTKDTKDTQDTQDTQDITPNCPNIPLPQVIGLVYERIYIFISCRIPTTTTTTTNITIHIYTYTWLYLDRYNITLVSSMGKADNRKMDSSSRELLVS